ncbi:MAG: SGNH/GDSL hydrolase family protein [Cyanobacteria bacterium P01_F01_bin.86]
MRKIPLKVGLAMSAAIAAALLPASAIAASFTELYVFGDSLVDSGNLFNVTSAFSAQGVPSVPPSPPYAQRNSNGPIWVDQLGAALGLSPILSSELALNPTAPPPTQGVNFAIAGAFSSDAHQVEDDLPVLGDLLPGFLDQVDAFTTLSAVSPAEPNALYVIWVGGIDYNEAFADPASLGDTPLEQLPNSVTDNILGGIEQLSSLGAQDFLVVNLPDLGESLLADTFDELTGQDISSVLNQLSTAHNALLDAKLGTFSQSQPETDITLLDVNTLFSDITANPEAFGLTNVTEACLTNFRPTFQFNGVCENPEEFLFWDDVHPTTAAYKLVTDLALAELNDAPPTAVPESTPIVALLFLGPLLGYFKHMAV